VSADRPREVLEAVRRLEAELEVLHHQARDRQRDAIDLREDLGADAALERRLMVEDLERVVDLIGASWRSTHDQVAALGRQVDALRAFVEDSVGSIKSARLELRLQTAASNGAEHAAR
jgi:multidrug resistance efflux pump